MKIGFIGCGKMAQVLLGTFVDSEVVNPSQIICSDIDHDILTRVRDSHGVWITGDNAYVFENANIIFLATKPQGFAEAVSAYQDKIRKDHLLVSIMAGVTIERIKSILHAPVIRVMPNTPCLVGQMAAGYAVDSDVPAEKEEFVETLLNCAGLAIKVDESELDAVTGLSGSSPAFIAYIIKHFIAAGVSEGLTPDESRELALQSFAGTALLMQKKNLDPETLIDMVSSPNGTTVAGREILENSDIADIIGKTIARAAQRSRELSK